MEQSKVRELATPEFVFFWIYAADIIVCRGASVARGILMGLPVKTKTSKPETNLSGLQLPWLQPIPAKCRGENFRNLIYEKFILA